MLNIFNSTIVSFVVLGAMLGVALGFNAITKEVEDGTLKSLLSSPVFRDELIVGKMIGATITLAFSLAIIFLIAIGVLLIYRIVPGNEDLIRISLFYIVTLLYCLVFFSIAMTASVFSKSSSMSLLTTISIVVVFSLATIISPLISNVITLVLLGPAPELSYSINPSESSVFEYNGSTHLLQSETNFFKLDAIYNEKRENIIDAITIFSPIDNYGGNVFIGNKGIASYILSPVEYKLHNYVVDILPVGIKVTLPETIHLIWFKVLLLISEISAAFAISYTKFRNIDV